MTKTFSRLSSNVFYFSLSGATLRQIVVSEYYVKGTVQIYFSKLTLRSSKCNHAVMVSDQVSTEILTALFLIRSPIIKAQINFVLNLKQNGSIINASEYYVQCRLSSQSLFLKTLT